MADCEHKFVYKGLIWANGEWPLPGSGAAKTYYGDAYFCEKCLEPRVEKMSNLDSNSYAKRLDGSTPASDREYELLVPSTDRSATRYPIR